MSLTDPAAPRQAIVGEPEVVEDAARVGSRASRTPPRGAR